MEEKHEMIGTMLSTTAGHAEQFADDIGLFKAIDSIVHGEQRYLRRRVQVKCAVISLLFLFS